MCQMAQKLSENVSNNEKRYPIYVKVMKKVTQYVSNGSKDWQKCAK
jgi:hypothetical protein